MNRRHSIVKPGALVLAALLLALAPLALAESERTTWELRVCADQSNLPYSNRQQQGFENRIIEMIAQELHARLSYLWLPKLRNADQDLLLLREGKCDVFLDVGDGLAPYLTTLAYYQTTYYFVYRADAPFKVTSLDDAVLHKLRIGAMAASPPDVALGVRGLVGNIRHYYPDPEHPGAPMMADVANGKLDLAVVWGPLAGYFADKQPAKLKLAPVKPRIETSSLSMVYAASMGLRAGDKELVDLLNQALAAKWDDIQKILSDYNIPLLPLPKPVLTIGGL